MLNKTKVVNNVSLVCILVNILLSIGKFIVGIIGHSSAIITDAVNSSGDVLSTIIIMIGNKISAKDADDEHPYGHEKFECIFMLIFVAMLAYVGLAMCKSGIETIHQGLTNPTFINTLETPTMITIYISIVTIIVKFIMTKVTYYYANKVKSMLLKADGKNHELDVITSILIVIALIFALNGVWYADAVASLIGCGFLFKLVIELFTDAVNGLVDTSANTEINTMAKKIALSVPGVKNIDRMRSRQFGSTVYIDIDIAVEPALTVNVGHNIAEQVHHKVQDEIEEVKHCNVHVNPYNANI